MEVNSPPSFPLLLVGIGQRHFDLRQMGQNIPSTILPTGTPCTLLPTSILRYRCSPPAAPSPRPSSLEAILPPCFQSAAATDLVVSKGMGRHFVHHQCAGTSKCDELRGSAVVFVGPSVQRGDCFRGGGAVVCVMRVMMMNVVARQAQRREGERNRYEAKILKYYSN